jgi:hypothetical protein
MLPTSSAIDKLDTIELRAFDGEYWHHWLSTMPIEFANLPFGEPLDESGERSHAPSAKTLFGSTNAGVAFLAPRGVGPTRWIDDAAKQIHIRRRFMLLGQTLDGMRVWDVRRAIEALRALGSPRISITLAGAQMDAGVSLYAALFEKKVNSVTLFSPPKSHSAGPDFLNVLRVLDLPQSVAMAAEHSDVMIAQKDSDGWQYPLSVVEKQGWGKNRIEFMPIKPSAANNASSQ